MKGRFKIIFLAVFIFVISIQSSVFGYNYDYEHHIYSDIVYYGISLNTFNEFIENPSIDILNNKCNFMEEYFVETDTNVALVTPGTRDTACDDNEHIISSEGILRDGYMGTITPNNLKYLTKENLSRVLKENNIYSSLENYAVITVKSYTYYNMPLTVWLKTDDNKSYFLAFMYDCPYCRDMVDYSKAYFMTHNMFKDRFSIHNGNIYFKDLNIKDDETVKIQDKNVFIPFEYLLNKLGSSYVTYDNENSKVYFEVNGEKYVFFRKLPGIGLEIYDGDNLPNPSRSNCIYFQTYYFDDSNREEYIETTYINTLLKLWNKKMKVDYDNRVVNIIDYDDYSMDVDEIYKLSYKLGSMCYHINEDGYALLTKKPYIQKNSNSFMIPLNTVKNMNVIWNSDTKTATVISGSDEIIFTVGCNYMIKNGKTIPINGIIEISEDSIYIPARALGEALGFNVNWIKNEDKVVLIR
ncbi:MAG: copper amine oxidase N-terminal domain-containing protein [Lachnospirales bacterium]